MAKENQALDRWGAKFASNGLTEKPVEPITYIVYVGTPSREEDLLHWKFRIKT